MDQRDAPETESSGPSKGSRPASDLSCGRLGLRVPFPRALELAHEHGFERIDPEADHLLALSPDDLVGLTERMTSWRIGWGADKLGVQFREDEGTFRTGLVGLRRHAEALARVGCRRIGTYLPPGSDTLTYDEHFEQTRRRLHEVASILQDYDVVLGVEYVATKPVRARSRYEFIHSLRQTLELVDAIGKPNVGLVLDSWHWHIAGETVSDLLDLRSIPIVAIDLNDAPGDVAVDALEENRLLPCSSGVIDIAGFVTALEAIGFVGPARVEVYRREIRAMGPERAVAAAATALSTALDAGRATPAGVAHGMARPFPTR